MKGARLLRFCIVGVGGHARTKLIPAIRANGQQLVGVVSRRADADEGAPRFATVEEAIVSLPDDTTFFIASPPTLHFDQALPALQAGRDVFLEKPAFITEAEARTAADAAAASGSLLVEGFMNRHTATHRLFLEAWQNERPVRIDATFTLPGVPRGTFRADSAIGASNLYDVASYVVGALIDAGADVSELRLVRVDNVGMPEQERLHLSGPVGSAEFTAVTGVAEAYENLIRLTGADGSEVTFTPFVYGRPGPRRVIRTRLGETNETLVEDVDAFEAMLAVPAEHWRRSAPRRVARMIELTRQLERLGRRLAELRAVAPPGPA